MKPIEVAAGLVFRDGRLLITRRHAESHLGGLWEFPGGKREGEETFPETLKRELREELGIEIAVGKLYAEIIHSYPEKTVKLQFFCCAWLCHEPQPLDCADFKWVTREELTAYAFPEADAQLLDTLRADLSVWVQA